LPFLNGLELTFRSQAEAWEADAVGQEAAVEEEAVAVDAEVVVAVARMRIHEHDEGME
jgi:hypothetical protein